MVIKSTSKKYYPNKSNNDDNNDKTIITKIQEKSFINYKI